MYNLFFCTCLIFFFFLFFVFFFFFFFFFFLFIFYFFQLETIHLKCIFVQTNCVYKSFEVCSTCVFYVHETSERKCSWLNFTSASKSVNIVNNMSVVSYAFDYSAVLMRRKVGNPYNSAQVRFNTNGLYICY